MVILSALVFYRLSYLGCPDVVGTTDFGFCIPPCFLGIFASGLERTLICWYGYEPWGVVKHVNGWCYRGIYNGGLWNDDLRAYSHCVTRC